MIFKYFDAHTHLNIRFADDWQEAGRRALEAGVAFVNVGADIKSSVLAVEQAKTLGDGVWATVGIHPTEDSADFSVIEKLATDEKVVAIGECGLEYFRLKNEEIKEKPDSAKSSVVAKQKELFKKHIELALKVGKPLMIHCRPASTRSFGEAKDAYEDTWEILKSYKDKFDNKLQFNMHFFAGDWSTAQKFLDLGGYLSFTGVITFTDQYDEVIKKMPLDRLMAETDAPFVTPKVDPKADFVAPVPHRGERNEPAFIQFVAERIAELRSEPGEEVLMALVQNAKNFFRL
ncbi:MAG: hypothetical protein A2607_02420 [Candidatus Vogelbacteria bacterium RIFOXYD1_FULL_42_15]|uniref:Hydrolase TatD n=1 Tax=Candidatus Vogelbacteria bacterium RIFOXYD1_FULL_42_15 TaxID=1802437 RepID=A0A1G2QDV0_9BACT|nr:MAG: hypothetical protein A2607_02420 [Candidatus Vogelbacteria bacterium RIFOXYD1_FULL_42_15]